MENKKDLFLYEELVQKTAEELIQSGKFDHDPLLEHFRNLTVNFAKVLKEFKKTVKISDNQQEYLQWTIEEKKRAEKSLQYMATMDALTGVYNRSTGLTLLEKQLESSRKNKSPLSICYIDINDLKYTNDHFGHHEGDQLLVSNCQYIKDAIRADHDIISRLGGDEFLIVFPQCTSEDVEKIISRIQAKMKNDNQQQRRPYSISFSYGIYEVDESYSHIEEMIQIADQRMFENKRNYKLKKGMDNE